MEVKIGRLNGWMREW